jgi:hypothetical protein
MKCTIANFFKYLNEADRLPPIAVVQAHQDALAERSLDRMDAELSITALAPDAEKPEG